MVTVIKPWLIQGETLAYFFLTDLLPELQNIRQSIWTFNNQFKYIYLHKLAYLK